MSIEVDVQYGDELSDEQCAELPTPEQITAWIEAALTGVAVPVHHRTGAPYQARDEAQLAVRIVGIAEGTALNQTYRHTRGPTNVLSFAVDAAASLPVPLLGDIVICAPVVEREAREQHKEVHAHWAHMVLHGTLHLLGYDHMDDSQAQEMETLETQILAGLGFSDPYNEKALSTE